METCFYCTPEDLREVFSALETDCPLVYEPFFGGTVTHTQIDRLLRAPFFRCGDIQDFGRVYPASLRFHVRPAEWAREGEFVILTFSGPPACLDDPDVLCEGSICLGPEAGGAELRAFYQRLKRALAKGFRKTGYCLLSPGVFARREDCLFIQRDTHFLSPAWRFGQGDRHVPAEMDA